MKKFLKGSEGFTLVELMVVVAIIGILSAVAIPNFKKYQAKSKQSEAKIQLAALYTAEVAANSDYDTYATCINVIGYENIPRGYYAIGFDAGFDATALNASLAGCGTAVTFVNAPSTQQLKANGTAPTTVAATADLTQNTFRAETAGNIAATGTDRWYITQTKDINNYDPQLN